MNPNSATNVGGAIHSSSESKVQGIKASFNSRYKQELVSIALSNKSSHCDKNCNSSKVCVNHPSNRKINRVVFKIRMENSLPKSNPEGGAHESP